MIRCNLFDGGMKPIYPPQEVPGMDELAYVEVDYETYLLDDPAVFCERTNAAMIAGGGQPANMVRMNPREDGLPYHMWIDRATQYEGDEGGLELEMLHHDTLKDPDTPAAHCDHMRVHHTPPVRLKLTDPERDWRVQRALSKVEEALKEQNLPPRRRIGRQLVRRWTKNESGATNLVEPAVLVIPNLQGEAFLPRIPDNFLFAPFDLSPEQRDRYNILDRAGNIISPESVYLKDGASYNLYLRPRTWRFASLILCHYCFISWFEIVPNDEIFMDIHYNRPPVYPVRHDVVHTRSVDAVQDFWGDWHGYDEGINWTWIHSHAQARLANSILQQQFVSPCLVYVFLGNEDPVVTIEQWYPKQNEVVAAIGMRDDVTGKESMIQIQCKDDQSDLYPRTLIGDFQIPWRVPGGGLFG